MTRFNRSLQLSLAILSTVAVAALAQNPEARSISYNIGRFSNGDTMSHRTVLRTRGPVIRIARGVLFQSMAGFARYDVATKQWRKVPENQVSLVRSSTGVCLKIGPAPCSALPFSPTDLRAIKAFVVANGTTAMSLATDADEYQPEVEKELAEQGLVKRPGKLAPEIWVSRHFAASRNLTLTVELLDLYPTLYSDKVKSAELERYRQALNNSLKTSVPSKQSLVDNSWLVSDLGANLVMFHDGKQLRCVGYPTRAHWQIGSSSEHAFVTKIEALEGTGVFPKIDEQNPSEEQLRSLIAAEGRWLFCATAAIRALHRLAPSKLAGL